MQRKNNKKAIDLFCGCGGISYGLRMAGYDIVAGLDIDKNMISTFIHNFKTAKAFTQNITELSPAEFAKKLSFEKEELDLLVGGPPCQGFSKNVPRKHRYLEDPKNLLMKSFLDYAEFFMPQTILMENVAEMKNGFEGQYTDEVMTRLSDAGYEVTHAVLNAADYGVPQRRKRAFFFANRCGVSFDVPQTTHSKSSETSQKKHITVWEAIGDLPSLKHGEGLDTTKYSTKAQCSFQTLVRNPHGVVKDHIAKLLKPKQLERLASLEPGQGLKDLPPHLQTKGGYSGAYGRLTKDMVAPTITRWVFHPGSGRWGHPVDTRVLSIREIARVQSFPDDFEFKGTYTQQCGQLGNAVPPILAATIIRDLDRQLNDQSLSKISARRSNEIFSSSEGKRKVTA